MTQFLVMYFYPLIVGLVLGLFYYGSLWLILRKLPQFSHPAVWVGISLILRTLAVMLMLYILFSDSWQQLVLAVVGIIISRTLLVQRIRPNPRHPQKANGAM
jgi:F1F0 ATPase subunit 2